VPKIIDPQISQIEIFNEIFYIFPT
jgi:hypothetical protein